MDLRAGCWKINSLRNESHCWHLYKLQSREGKELKVLVKGFILFLSCSFSVCYSGQVRISSNWEFRSLHPWEGRLLLGEAGHEKIPHSMCGNQNPLSAGARTSFLLIYSRLVLELFMFCPGVKQIWKHCRTPKFSL